MEGIEMVLEEERLGRIRALLMEIFREVNELNKFRGAEPIPEEAFDDFMMTLTLEMEGRHVGVNFGVCRNETTDRQHAAYCAETAQNLLEIVMRRSGERTSRIEA